MDCLKKLMYMQRNTILLSFKENEEKTVFIKKTCEEWEKLEPVIIKTLKKMRDTWTKDINSKIEEMYFG